MVWTYMASLLQRVLRGLPRPCHQDGLARPASTFLRAGHYSKHRQIDYFPAQEMGAGGAEKLQLNLAQLEAEHIDGLEEMIPIKLTFSLVRDFSLQFAQLLDTGGVHFQTTRPCCRSRVRHLRLQDNRRNPR